VRLAVTFSTLLGQPLRLLNARTKREQLGLRPQHLASVIACVGLQGQEKMIEGIGFCR